MYSDVLKHNEANDGEDTRNRETDELKIYAMSIDDIIKLENHAIL